MKLSIGIIIGVVVAIIISNILSGIQKLRVEKDKKAIHKLVDDYYNALRKKKYKEAAGYYEPDALKILGTSPEKTLEMACQLSGSIPNDITLETLRIKGNKATGEIVIQRKGIGNVSIQMYEEKDKRIGTWAKTLNFVKIKGEWKISGDNTNTAGADMEKTLKMLKDIQRKQAENKK